VYAFIVTAYLEFGDYYPRKSRVAYHTESLGALSRADANVITTKSTGGQRWFEPVEVAASDFYIGSN